MKKTLKANTSVQIPLLVFPKKTEDLKILNWQIKCISKNQWDLLKLTLRDVRDSGLGVKEKLEEKKRH